MSDTDEALDYIRRVYGVPARIGGRLRYSGSLGEPQLGTILGGRSQYLRVRLSGLPYEVILHPTWEVEYLP